MRQKGPLTLGRSPADADTEGMLVNEGLELLTETECLQLLGQAEVGRVGVTMGALPAIFPVNYALIDGQVVFRTSPGSKLSAATAGAVVAFEVDNYAAAERTGWSVLVVGQSVVVHDIEVTSKVLSAGLEPWVDGLRTSIVRIEPGFISGRRIVREHAVAPR
jgi:nitroimidazol reductase NimA-like FMN-containing flavoprotein (pyridoxamine 5'-phosphate oxidase superfamily)